jgi:chromosome segregation protein
VLTSERAARSALEATAAEVPNLQLTVQKLEGKVVKLRSSLDKSRAEALNLRETLQQERDMQFNLQLRHTTEKEAFAATAAAAARAQEEELDRLRAIVAAPNAPLLALEVQLLRAQAESSQARSALAESAQVLQAFQKASAEREKGLQEREALLRGEHDAAVQALEEQLRSLREQVETATTSATESDVASAVLRGQLEMQKLCLTEAQNSNSAVQVRLAQSEKEVEQLQEDIRSKAEAMDALLDLVRSTEEAFTAERAKMQADFDEHRAVLSAECDALRVQVEASAAAVTSLQSELATVREQASLAESTHMQRLQELRTELDERSLQLEAAKETAREEQARLEETLRSEQDSSAEKENALKAEITALLGKQETDRLQLRDVTATSSELTRQLGELEAALAAAQADLQASGARQAELSTTISVRQEEVSEAAGRLAEQVEVIADLISKQKELEATCADLRSQLQLCEAQKLAAVQRAEGLEEETESLKARIQEAQRQISSGDEKLECTTLNLAKVLISHRGTCLIPSLTICAHCFI